MREEERKDSSRGWSVAIVAHPVISGVIASCTLIGAVLGLFLLTGEWSIARRIAAGVVGGAGVGILITAPRIIG